MQTTVFCSIVILAAGMCSAKLVVRRTSGFDPDRFTDSAECTSHACSERYGGAMEVLDSCQCRCTSERPTFSLLTSKCVQSIPDCKELMLSGSKGQGHGSLFTILVSTNLIVTPKLAVREMSTGASITQILPCQSPVIASTYYQTTDGYRVLESPTLTALTDHRTNNTYLQFQRNEEGSLTETDISGLVLLANFTCGTKPAREALCLPFKIHGFQKVDSGQRVTKAQSLRGSTTTPLNLLPSRLPYIIGGIVLVVVVGVVISIIAIIIRGWESSMHKRIRVKRVERQWSINSTRKKPIRKVFRSLSLGDLQDQNRNFTQSHRKWKDFPGSELSTISRDSGRGKSRSPSTGNTGYDAQAITDAICTFQSQLVNNLKVQEGSPQPQLFKSHQAKLSTAGNGITSLPAQTHKLISGASKKLSPLKRLFRKKKTAGSDTSGSRLSIDYEHFSIREAPGSATHQGSVNRATGKRFSDAHINPDVSFSTEGKLAQTEEVQLDLPYCVKTPDIELVDNDLYQCSSSNSIQQLNTYSTDIEDELPVTCIDDVTGDSVSDFEVYESVQQHKDMQDFSV